MKTVFTLITLFLAVHTFCQNTTLRESTTQLNYSQNSKVKVFYSDHSSKLNSDQKRVGVFIEDKFIGNQEVLSFINPEKIETLKVEKKQHKINGIPYDGKILITMKSNYKSQFLKLEALSSKYLKLNGNPIIYQIDSKIIGNQKDEIFIDENFILKIIVKEIKTSEKNTAINLISILTKTSDNIQKANEIRIKGRE